jgi:hypothetical protein
MSAVSDAIPGYLALRRALGFKLASHGRLLESFAAYLESTGAPAITTEAALAWATLPRQAQPVRWKARLCVARGFARYLATVDPAVQVPPEGLLGYRRQRHASWRGNPRQRRAATAGHRADSGAGGLPRPDGREPSGRGAATRSAGPHAQAGSSPPQRTHEDRDRENWPDRPPRAGHSLAEQRSPSRARQRARPSDGASATPDCDLPQLDLGTYQEDGGRPSPLSPVQRG